MPGKALKLLIRRQTFSGSRRTVPSVSRNCTPTWKNTLPAPPDFTPGETRNRIEPVNRTVVAQAINDDESRIPG
jgi:hypothetical protein